MKRYSNPADVSVTIWLGTTPSMFITRIAAGVLVAFFAIAAIPAHATSVEVSFSGAASNSSTTQPAAGAFKSVDGLDAGVRSTSDGSDLRSATDILITIDRPGS